jgi:hypothetical protein
MMLITTEGFGRIWSKRTRPDPNDPERERTAYYNTTGVCIGSQVRHRSRIFGQLRFNGVGGFIANGIERNIGRVFRCSGELHTGSAKLIVRHLAAQPERPDYFLFAVKSDFVGVLPIELEGWSADGVLVFSLSQTKECQEALLLMPPHSWFRAGRGIFMADPRPDIPWRATLRFLG